MQWPTPQQPLRWRIARQRGAGEVSERRAWPLVEPAMQGPPHPQSSGKPAIELQRADAVGREGPISHRATLVVRDLAHSLL